MLLSGGAIWVSEYLGIPKLASIAMMLFSLWMVAGGVEVAFKGEVTLINREHRRYEFFSGIPAGLWSVIYITTGLGFLGLAWLDFSSPGGSDGFFDRILNTPSGWGMIVGFAGMVTTATGVIRFLAGSASAHKKVGWIEEFGFRAGGLITTLIGMTLLALAAGLLFAPDLVHKLFTFLKSIVEDWLLSM